MDEYLTCTFGDASLSLFDPLLASSLAVSSDTRAVDDERPFFREVLSSLSEGSLFLPRVRRVRLDFAPSGGSCRDDDEVFPDGAACSVDDADGATADAVGVA